MTISIAGCPMAAGRRRILGVPLLIASLCLAAWGCGAESGYVAPPPPTVTVAEPVSKPVTDYLEVTGSVAASDTVEIRARVEGFLQKVEFREGQVVEEGDLLYMIDPREFETSLGQAKAAERTAQASLSLASATLKRRETAARTGAVSELEVLENRAQRDVARASLQSAQAEVRRAELDLGYTEIRAPISGRIGHNKVDVGNLVGSGESTLLTTIIRYDPIHVYFTINERQLLRISGANEGKVPEGDRVTVIDGIPLEAGRSTDEGYPFRGNLDLADQGVNRETGTLMLRAVFPNPAPPKLIPGLFVRARFPLRQRDDALLVSERALGADQTGRYVLVVGQDDVVEHRSVKMGALVDGLRVIEEGVEAGDRVITNGLLFARPGAKVVPQVEGAKPPDSAGS